MEESEKNVLTVYSVLDEWSTTNKLNTRVKNDKLRFGLFHIIHLCIQAVYNFDEPDYLY